MGLGAAYVRSLERQPLVTKAVTSAVLNALEEAIAQHLGAKPASTDTIVKKGIYGLTVSSVLGHHLYALVDRIFAGYTGALASLGKLAVINLTVVPITTWVYYYALAAIAGKKPSESRKDAARLTPGTVVMTWKLFIPLQLLVVKFVPPVLWLPVFNLVGFIFGVYLNVAAGRANKK